MVNQSTCLTPRTLKMLLVTLFIICVKSQLVNPCTRSNEMAFNGICYVRITSKIAFQSVNSMCGSHFYDTYGRNDRVSSSCSVHNDAVNDFIRNNVLLGSWNGIWIGLRKNESSNSTYWIDDTPTDYAPPIVSGSPSDTCFVIKSDDTSWYEVDCSTILQYGGCCSFTIPTCDNILSSDPTVCNSVGVCVTDSNCSCDSSWFGSYCSIFGCFGLSSNDPNQCNGHTCSAIDECRCDQVDCESKYGEETCVFGGDCGEIVYGCIYNRSAHEFQMNYTTSQELITNHEYFKEEVDEKNYVECEFVIKNSGDYGIFKSQSCYFVVIDGMSEKLVIRLSSSFTYSSEDTPSITLEALKQRPGENDRVITLIITDSNPLPPPPPPPDNSLMWKIIAGVLGGVVGVCFLLLLIITFFVLGGWLCYRIKESVEIKKYQDKGLKSPFKKKRFLRLSLFDSLDAPLKEASHSIIEDDLKDSMNDLEMKESAREDRFDKFGQVPFEKVKLLERQFQGTHYDVHNAQWIDETDIMFKIYKFEEENNVETFVEEMKVFSSLEHERIIEYFSFAKKGEDTIGVILEEMPNGSVEKYLENEENELSFSEKIRSLREIVDVMSFLCQKKILLKPFDFPKIVFFTRLMSVKLDYCFHKTFENTTDWKKSKYSAPEILKPGLKVLDDLDDDPKKQNEESMIDFKSDVFSFAMLAYAVIARDFKWSENVDAGIKMANDENFRPPTGGDINPLIVNVLKIGWQNSPVNRVSWERLGVLLANIQENL